MIDRLFTLTLSFAILAGATLAIGDEFFSTTLPSQPAPTVVQLPRVVITGKIQRAGTAVASAESSASKDSTDAGRVQ